MTNPRLFKSIESFKIHGKLPESDHLPISFSIQCLSQTNERHTSAGITSNEWQPQTKFLWCESDLTNIKHAFTDSDGQSALKNFNDSLADLSETNQVALALNNYISQAIARVCRPCRPKTKKIKNGPRWFDNRCRQLRSEAVRAGERVMCETDRENLITKCKEYRSHKQRKNGSTTITSRKTLKMHSQKIRPVCGLLLTKLVELT